MAFCRDQPGAGRVVINEARESGDGIGFERECRDAGALEDISDGLLPCGYDHRRFGSIGEGSRIAREGWNVIALAGNGKADHEIVRRILLCEDG